jgi:hypothetical protein
MEKKNMKKRVLYFVSTLLLAVTATYAQTTEISYQGHLQSGGAAANGDFDLEFRLFDSLAGGTQVGPALTRTNVPVINGIFGVKLDFGAAFPGADRFLEIHARTAGGGAYTPLSPRQRVNSTPYSIKSASAETASNSLRLGGVDASEYVTNTTGGTSFIRNGTSLQTGNFNVSGNGSVGGRFGIGTSTPDPFYNLEVIGAVKTAAVSSTHFVAHTTGVGPNNWARNYWRSPSRSWLMGTSQGFNNNQLYIADETAGETRMVFTTAGQVGIGTTAPGSLLEIAGPAGLSQQRITDSTSGNSLVLQSGSGSNMKVTGYHYPTGTPIPLYLSVDGANTVMNSGGGNISQPGAGFGVPKAMIYLLDNGAIGRCYNGITGSTTGNCGFSPSRSSAGVYKVDFGFQVNKRFYFLTTATPDRYALWNSGCFDCNANQLLINVNNNSGVGVDSRLMILVF